MSNRCVNFHGVETEGAVTGDDGNEAVWAGQTCRHAERRTDTDTAKRTRIEVGLGGQSHARKTQKVTTIRDHHRVGWQDVA